MKVTRIQARKLCTAAEMALADESYSPLLEGLSVKELKQRIVRARKLRDKFNDLAAKQSREIQGKAKPTRSKTPTGNAGTVTKAAFFTETLARFEERLVKVEKQIAAEKLKAEREKAKAAAEKKKELIRKAAASAPKPVKLKGTVAAPGKLPAAKPNLTRKSAAVRATNARNQAKRDSRGKK